MKSLSSFNAIFIVFSILFASDTSADLVNKVQASDSEISDKKINETVSIPINVDYFKDMRFEKAVLKKKKSEIILKEQKDKKEAEKKFFEDQLIKADQNSILKKWSKDIRSKFSVGTLKKENGESAIQLPSSNKKN